MQKRYPNQRWTQPLLSHIEKLKPSKLEIWAERFNLCRKIALDVIFFASLSGFLLVVYKELKRTEIILDPINIPEELKHVGYNGTIVAEKLLDEARKISRELRKPYRIASWNKETYNISELWAEEHAPDIQIPGASFTLRSLVRYLRKELGFESVYLRGEVIKTVNGLSLTLRNISQPDIPAVQTPSKTNLRQLLEEHGGAALLKISKPSILAVQAYHQFLDHINNDKQKGQAFDKLKAQLDYCLNQPPDTDDNLMFFLWGEAMLEMHNPEEAIKWFILIKKKDPPSYNGWGNALSDLNDKQGAIEKYQIAIQIDPNYAPAYNNLGNALSDLKRYDEAICNYQKAIKQYPNFADAYKNWGNTLSNSGKKEEAILKYKKAIEINPHFADAYKNWGIVLSDLNDKQGAIERYKKTIEFDPKNADAYNYLGNALDDLKFYDKAIVEYRKAIKLKPNDVNFYKHLGNVLEKLGRQKEAEEVFKKSKAIKEQ